MVQQILHPSREPVCVDADSPDPRFWVRAVPLAGTGSMSSVFSTVHLGEDGVTVIDPGWTDSPDRYLTELDEFLRSHGRTLGEVGDVVVTHAHPDHIGAAATLLDATGARYSIGSVEQETIDAARNGTGVDDYVVTHAATGAPEASLETSLRYLDTPIRLDHVPDRTPDVLIGDGDILPCGLEAVVTPGHTPGHLTLIDRDRRIAVIADHILPDINAGAGLGVASLGGNPVADYLNSLREFSLYDGYLAVPGHGFCFTGLGERRRQAEEHMLVRAREVREVLDRDPGVSVWDLASRLTWTLGWDGMLESPMLVSGLQQVMMYRDLVT